MFDYIKGEIENRVENNKGFFFTVEVGGIGYFIEVIRKDFEKNTEENVKLYTVLNHREDSMSLCGFLNRQTRDIFNILTSVSGVGLKMGLTLLNEFDTEDLISFVINEDFKSLTQAKGVGAKLAQKIILELKDKLLNFEPTAKIGEKTDLPSKFKDVQQILISLGYDNDEIKTAFKRTEKLISSELQNDEILKILLQNLSQ